MPIINFATSNKDKLSIAHAVCAQFGLTVQQIKLEIDEIQGEDSRLIVEDKACRAYEKLLKPVVVSDDTWGVPALKGFPGAYMKSMNEWFTAQDFLRLMDGVKDRTIILYQYLAYCDGRTLQVFHNDIHGHITDKPQGKSNQSPATTVIALDYDNGKTIAEVFEQDINTVMERYRDHAPDAWHELINWYIPYSAK